MITIEIRNFRAHETLGVPTTFDPAIPVPAAGDVIEFNETPYVCRHRSFEYRGSELVHVYVMIEPDDD
jgi:hypothetical protein